MVSRLNNRLTDLLHCTLPIVLAGMGGVARAELAGAVATAGGFGFLGMVREPAELIEREVKQLRAQGHDWFGVNIIPAATDPGLLQRQVDTCIKLAVPVVGLFWDIDAAVVARLRAAGIVVVYQVGSVDEAVAAERAGAQIIIAQGREAGGHVRGTRLLRDLLPEVVAAVQVPVVAAGGLASGSDLVTALALGAEGIALGTALMATTEAFAHDAHKQALLIARAEDTVLTDAFHINWPPGAPVRVLKSAITSGARGPTHGPERTPIGDEEGRPIYLFSTDSPLRSMTGDFASMALYAGTGVGQIDAITGAGDRLRAIIAEAEPLLAKQRVKAVPELASPVCYAGEVGGAYMGGLSDHEIAENISILASDMRMALRLTLADRTDAQSSEPPFSPEAVDYARWALVLQHLATELGVRAVDPNFPSPSPGEITWEVARLHVLMLHRLGTLVSSLPEGDMRQRLQPMVTFLEARKPVPVRRALHRALGRSD
ncbi:MAG TPA: nitronate monooxygenase [Devosia sp.]|nr:nitronate monooxygenase [Devosia sp.]